MAFFLVILLIVGMGAITAYLGNLTTITPVEVRESDAGKLLETLNSLYEKEFYRDTVVFSGTLQDFCRQHGLNCRDYKGEWRWVKEEKLSPSGLFSYYIIKIYDAAGRELGRVSGEKYWSSYLTRIETNQNAICKALIDYYRDMVRVYSYPLNWYAKNGASCTYDGGVDSLQFGGARIEKEVNCSEGWRDLKREAGNLGSIVGGKWRWPTGTLQYDNGNEIYTYGYPCYGATTVDGQVLTGNQPPYAVAFRLWIKTGYYQVCCGY